MTWSGPIGPVIRKRSFLRTELSVAGNEAMRHRTAAIISELAINTYRQGKTECRAAAGSIRS